MIEQSDSAEHFQDVKAQVLYICKCASKFYDKASFLSHVSSSHSITAKLLKMQYSPGLITYSIFEMRLDGLKPPITTRPTIGRSNPSLVRNIGSKPQLHQRYIQQQQKRKRKQKPRASQPKQEQTKQLPEKNSLKKLTTILLNKWDSFNVPKIDFYILESSKTNLGNIVCAYIQSWKVGDNIEVAQLMEMRDEIIILNVLLIAEKIYLQQIKQGQLSLTTTIMFLNYFVLNFVPNLHLKQFVRQWANQNQALNLLKSAKVFEKICEFVLFGRRHYGSMLIFKNINLEEIKQMLNMNDQLRNDL